MISFIHILSIKVTRFCATRADFIITLPILEELHRLLQKLSFRWLYIPFIKRRSLLLTHPQRSDESFLRDRYVSVFSHSSLALLLLLQQLLLARDIAAIAFRRHVLAHGGDGFAGDDFAADRCLDGDFEQVAGDQVF